ncbi:TPM domain-containing protein [candidate division KSB1 bacterium]|nr:TPM domain-containing protein [candidate division KSB1 bacterium]
MKNSFFTMDEIHQIVSTIQETEKMTSGEIRVHVENRCWQNPLRRAILIFKKLNMHRTKLHNGILIYLALKSHKFAIIGDRNINEKVPEDFWEVIIKNMQPYFQENKICEGICETIQQVGEKLKEFFPPVKDDTDELTNEISFGT